MAVEEATVVPTVHLSNGACLPPCLAVIIDAMRDVCNTQQYLTTEEIIKAMLLVALNERRGAGQQLAVREQPIRVFFHGLVVGFRKADIVTGDGVVVEVKLGRATETHVEQIKDYIINICRDSGKRGVYGVLLHFTTDGFLATVFQEVRGTVVNLGTYKYERETTDKCIGTARPKFKRQREYGKVNQNGGEETVCLLGETDE